SSATSKKAASAMRAPPSDDRRANAGEPDVDDDRPVSELSSWRLGQPSAHAAAPPSTARRARRRGGEEARGSITRFAGGAGPWQPSRDRQGPDRMKAVRGGFGG